MSNAKELKFQFVLDSQSFQQVKRALGELTTEAQKFAKAMQAGGGGLFGGANVGSKTPSIAQTQAKQPKFSIGSAILADAEAFQKLAKSGRDGMAAMTDAVRKGVREQMNEIDRLESKLARLHLRLQKDPRAAYEGAFRDRLQAQLLTRQGQLNSANDRLGQLKELQGGLTPGAPAAGGWFGGVPLAPTTLAGWGRVAGLAATGGMSILQMSNATNNMWGDSVAGRGQTMRGILSNVRRADISDQMKLRYLSRLDSTERAEMAARLYGGDRKALDFIGAITTTAKGVGSALTGGALGDPSAAAGGALTDMATDTRSAERLKEVMERINDDARYYQSYGRGLDYAESTRNTRINSARIRGAGFYRDPRTGELKDTFTKTHRNLLESGYDDSMLDAAVVQARNLAGRQFAGKNAGAIMAANAVGYGGYANVLGAAGRLGDTSLAGLALGGRIDTAAGIMLGQGVLGSGFDVRGTTSGIGILNASQGLGFNMTGGAGDFNQVQQILAGAQLGTAVTSGALDPYQAGRNIINAIGVNPGGTTYAQDYLGTGLSFKQMMDAASGDITKTGKALGITSDMARQQLSGSMSSVLDRFVDQGGSDPMSRAIRGFRSSGETIDSYLNSLYRGGKREEADAIGSFFGMVSGEGEEAGIGLAGLLGGIGTKGRFKRGPGGGIDDESKAKLEALSEQVQKDKEAMRDVFNDILAGFKENKSFGNTMSSFAELGTSIQAVIDKFNELAGITPAVKAKVDRAGVTGFFKATASDGPGKTPTGAPVTFGPK